MRLTVTRARSIGAAGLLTAAAVTAVLLASPWDDRGARAGSTGPDRGALLISEFHPNASNLYLIDPSDLASRAPYLDVPHATGWEIIGALAPDGTRFAYLVLPPGTYDPSTQAQLALRDHNGLRVLADRLDLGGGLVWSADGSALYARRTAADGVHQSLIEVDAEHGETRTRFEGGESLSLYAVGRPADGPLYVVVIGSNGSKLVALDGSGRPARSLSLSSGVTRDWALSADGAHLAFTEQQGLQLHVRVVSLRDDTPTLSVASAIAAAPTAGSGSAAPLWHPDGSLSVGTFGAKDSSSVLRVQAAGAAEVDVRPASGFALPVAWSADGRRLALRAFTGRGPGDVGQERAALIGPDGQLHTIEGEFIRVLGWWYGGD